MDFNDKPKAFIAADYGALDNLAAMINSAPELYDQCISTDNFSFHFGQIANKAVHFDYLVSKGFIPKEYLIDNTIRKIII
jgi:hypothetical protein